MRSISAERHILDDPEMEGLVGEEDSDVPEGLQTGRHETSQLKDSEPPSDETATADEHNTNLREQEEWTCCGDGHDKDRLEDHWSDPSFIPKLSAT
ncbi:hypothetical protein JCM5296_001433 [Sporobolomyces johnsonii]